MVQLLNHNSGLPLGKRVVPAGFAYIEAGALAVPLRDLGATGQTHCGHAVMTCPLHIVAVGGVGGGGRRG